MLQVLVKTMLVKHKPLNEILEFTDLYATTNLFAGV